MKRCSSCIVLGRALGRGQGRLKRKPTLAQHMWVAPRAGRPKAVSHGSWWAESQLQQDRAAFMAKAAALFPSAPAEKMQLKEWIA